MKPEKFPPARPLLSPPQSLPSPSTRENPDRPQSAHRIPAKIPAHSQGNTPRHSRHPEKSKSSVDADSPLVLPDTSIAHVNPSPPLSNPSGYTQTQSNPTNGDREI